MKKYSYSHLILIILWLSSSHAWGKTKTVSIDLPNPYPPTFDWGGDVRQYSFKMEIIGDQTGKFTEIPTGDAATIYVPKNERYAVRLTNPLPVRAAVNLTIDGLNSISGKPCGIFDGDKWIIEPFSFIIIKGWQVNAETSRRFFFTDKSKSYASWRSQKIGTDLSLNCGVIGAAFFWNNEELRRYFRQQRKPMGNKTTSQQGLDIRASESNSPSEATEPMKNQAGTGMGEREEHPVQPVEFKPDTGMMSVDDALLIYTEFTAQRHPQAFPGLSFAPEMP